jgi:hypothetical protein
VLTAVDLQRVGQIDSALHTINELNSVKQRYAINFRGSVPDRAISPRDEEGFDGANVVAASERELDRLVEFYARSAAPPDALAVGASTGHAEERSILGSIKAIQVETVPLPAQGRTFGAASGRLIAAARKRARAVICPRPLHLRSFRDALVRQQASGRSNTKLSPEVPP